MKSAPRKASTALCAACVLPVAPQAFRIRRLRMLARRLYGKYIAPEVQSISEKRVAEIKDGDVLPSLWKTLMDKPMSELKELYNNREIEK